MSPADSTRQEAVARSVVMGTAGHIDHGKTALILALTGTDTDRLPEEKARGITIDLGFAALDINDVEKGSVHLGLVDVPGHHAFIHNMLAGAGGIDCVLLVVAADEGVKAQTIEHVAICSLLGVRYGAIALTKKDAVNAERLELAHREIQEFAKGTILEDAPIISVSARTGEGIEDLKEVLLELALRVPKHSTDTLLRLPLDRAFSIPGFGTVVTGTLRDGMVRAGDSLELIPERRQVRVRGVQIHQKSVKEAAAPTRAALNLAGIEVAEVHRGDTIVQHDAFFVTRTVDAELTVLPGAPPVKHRSKLGLHAFTSENTATVLYYRAEEGGGSGPRLVRLRLKKPMLLVPGDRFVLRRPDGILGGGRILDANPIPRWRKSAVREWLEGIRDASPEQQFLARVRRRGKEGINLSALGQEIGWNADAIRRVIRGLMATNQVLGVGVDQATPDRFLDPDALTQAVELLLKELTKKESRSGSRAELISRTRLQEWVFDLAIARLRKENRIRIAGSEISIDSGGAVDGKQADLLAKVEELFRSAGLASPAVTEVATKLRIEAKDLRPVITLLLRAGKLARMGSDNLLIHTDALEKLKAELKKMRGQTIDIGRFKELTGLTRKYAIPVLEYLDRARVTLNKQDIRTVL